MAVSMFMQPFTKPSKSHSRPSGFFFGLDKALISSRPHILALLFSDVMKTLCPKIKINSLKKDKFNFTPFLMSKVTQFVKRHPMIYSETVDDIVGKYFDCFH